MGSNAKKTRLIRARKAKSNRKNLKKNKLRIENNSQILRDLAARSDKE
jgi:hypothetical protein